MNTFSRIVTLAAIVCFGGAMASEGFFTKDNFFKYADIPANFTRNNWYTIGTAGIEKLLSANNYLKKDQHLVGSTIRGIGYAIDQMRADSAADIFDPVFLAKTFVVGIGGNYAVDKTGKFLHDRGITVKNTVGKCDKLPETAYMRNVAKVVVETSGNTLTEPSVAFYLLNNYIVPSMIGMGSSVIKYFSGSGSQLK